MAYEFLKNILKHTSQAENKYIVPLKNIINEQVEFFSAHFLSYLFEIPPENIKEKCDLVVILVKILTRLIKFAIKHDDVNLKYTI